MKYSLVVLVSILGVIISNKNKWFVLSNLTRRGNEGRYFCHPLYVIYVRNNAINSQCFEVVVQVSVKNSLQI